MIYAWTHVAKPHSRRVAVFVAALLLATALLVGCSQEPELDPPAQAVQGLLELRAERSTDASAYAEYVRDPAFAVTLAQSAEEEADAENPPIPDWQAPFASTDVTETAEVIVVWEDTDDYTDWPVATTFMVETLDGRWIVADAFPVEDEGDIPEKPE